MDKDLFMQRANIMRYIRQWFEMHGFLNVETPIIVKHPDLAPDLDLFSTEFVSKDGKNRERLYLQTSPEYSMKKLLGRGFGSIFQICKTFRNSEWLGNGASESRHNPEFTMLEWYRVNADYHDIMNDTEDMVSWVGVELGLGKRDWTHEDWERLSVRDAYKKYADLDLDNLRTLESLRAAVAKKGYELNANYNWDDLFFLVMLNEIEPKLGFEHPVFLYDYPASQAALAKKKTDDPFWAERFELYIDGIELCNAFSELTDPVEQRARFEAERGARKVMGKEDIGIDEELLKALETMPRCAGNALGIDRLVMVLLGKKSIEEVLLFPWSGL